VGHAEGMRRGPPAFTGVGENQTLATEPSESGVFRPGGISYRSNLLGSWQRT
jgi:hypothetical protein